MNHAALTEDPEDDLHVSRITEEPTAPPQAPVNVQAKVNAKGEVVRHDGPPVPMDPIVERLLAAEASRMVDNGIMPAAGPAPSRGAESVRDLYAETEAKLLTQAPINACMNNDPRKRQNRHVLYYGDPKTKERFWGIYLAECSSDHTHWRDCDTKLLLHNVHVLPELERACGLMQVKNSLQTAMAELTHQTHAAP